MPAWARLIALFAALRVGAGLAFYLSGHVAPGGETPLPLGVYALLGFSFALVGGGLIVGNDRDARAAWLGGVLVLLAVPMTQRLVAQEFAPTYVTIARLRPDVFLPAFLWRFASAFPSPLQRPLGSIALAGTWLLFAFGMTALAINFSTAFDTFGGATDWRAPWVIARGGGTLYWPVTVLTSLGALLILLFRFAASRHEERFRLKIFVGSLVIGLSPLFLTVLLEETVPGFEQWSHQPHVEPWVALTLFGPMAFVPATTAYSVLYDHIVDVRVLLRLAVRYALARITTIAVTAVPFVALGVFLYQHRTESLVTLLTGTRPLLLMACVAAGGLSLRRHSHWLAALDRRYFREHHDTQVLLTHLMTGDWLSQAPSDIAARLARELDTAFHARADLFLLDDVSGNLERAVGQGPALHVRGTLASLLTAEAQPMDVALSQDSALARLPEAERVWLRDGGYVLLVPLRSRTNDLLGLLALGGKRSELPYADSDRRSLMAIAMPVSLALENDRLRSAPASDAYPATECQSCSRLHGRGTTQCSCGGTLSEAPAPHLLRGVFQFERRLGAGGMGVVYVARDLALQRSVAIKTLPHITGPHQERLRAEALAMASLVDPNLAVIYGIESWRGMPFLIEEYLEGGTLGDRLSRGPLPIASALELGSTLAATLARLHSAGVVHCDIKPSNIGFSAAGVPKLIDFGLAHLLRSSGETLTATMSRPKEVSETQPPATIVTEHGVVGTPPYMSPEALQASTPQPSFDTWALCIVLFEMIAGRRPFAGRTFAEITLAVMSGPIPDLRQHRRDCAEPLAEFFVRAFSRQPGARPQNAEELRAQIDALRLGPS